MSKKSFKDIGSQAARAFITIEPTPQSTEPPAQSIPTPAAIPAAVQSAVQPPSAERRPGRPRTNKRVITKSSQENLPENWTRATFIVREDLLNAFKEHSAEAGITLKEAVNTALEQYLNGGISHD